MFVSTFLDVVEVLLTELVERPANQKFGYKKFTNGFLSTVFQCVQYIIKNNNIDNFFLLESSFNNLCTPININFEHNNSKFNFDNLVEFELCLKIINNNFKVKKIELHKVSRDVTDFTEANHIESNFSNLMDTTYIITSYFSHSIDQATLTIGNSLQKKILTNVSKL